MEIVVNWENIHSNEYLEARIIKSLNKSLSKYDYLSKLNLNILKISANSRYCIRLEALTNNPLEILRQEGVASDILPALNDLTMKFKDDLKHYDKKDYEKRKLLEEQWQQQAAINRELKQQQLQKNKEIIEENKRRIEINEKIRRKNEQTKRDYAIQKDLLKKLHRQAVLDEQTRYELQKDFLERQRIKKEQEMLRDARLREIARIKREAIIKDLDLENKYKDKKQELFQLKTETNEVNRIKNDIITLQSSDYDDIWAANDPFQNEEDGTWYYHDGEGHIYELDESGEWKEDTERIKKTLDAIKQKRVEKLLDQKDVALARQEKVSNEEYLREKNMTLDTKDLKKASKDIEEKDKLLEDLVKEKEDKLLNFNETHPANEPWLDETSNKYYYHDGEGNYFTTNENNEWIATNNPYLEAVAEEYEKKREECLSTPSEEEVKEKAQSEKLSRNQTRVLTEVEALKNADTDTNKKHKKKSKKKNKNETLEQEEWESSANSQKENIIPKANEPYEFMGHWYYFDDEGNYYIANENNEWSSTVNPHATGVTLDDKHNIINQPEDSKTKALEDNYDHSDPFQDENGVWWYIDENNQYYYADEQGNWIKWVENN